MNVTSPAPQMPSWTVVKVLPPRETGNRKQRRAKRSERRRSERRTR